MMSLRSIVSASEQAARRAAAKGQRPREIGSWLAEQPERLAKHLRGMPFIGTWVPADLELVPRNELDTTPGVTPQRLAHLGCGERHLFVDSSGLGSQDEPALTFEEFVELVAANAGYSYAIAEAGQFQVVIGVFRKRGSKKAN